MSAPKKNDFWKRRTKHGRDKLFASPELLWQAACEYFQYCEDNPLNEVKVFGTGKRANVPKMRAMTLSGLCLYLGCNEAYFRQFRSNLPQGEQGFSTVIDQIETVIYNQKFQGASAGLLNANIISRDLGLAERSNVDVTTDLSQLSDEQLITISNELFKKQQQNGKRSND
jgi:hypothetical protein